MYRGHTRKTLLLGLAALVMLGLLTACAPAPAPAPQATAGDAAVTQAVEPTNTETAEKAGEYQLITAEKAKQIMDNEQGVTVVDVREPDEYQAGHIANAKLLPLGQLAKLAGTELPDKNATILVYCRSGARSQMGASTLISLGYTHVLDMGGLMNWPYSIVK